MNFDSFYLVFQAMNLQTVNTTGAAEDGTV